MASTLDLENSFTMKLTLLVDALGAFNFLIACRVAQLHAMGLSARSSTLLRPLIASLV